MTINGLHTVKYHVKVGWEPQKILSQMGFFEHQESHAKFVTKRFLMKKRKYDKETENTQTVKKQRNRGMPRNRVKLEKIRINLAKRKKNWKKS